MLEARGLVREHLEHRKCKGGGEKREVTIREHRGVQRWCIIGNHWLALVVLSGHPLHG